MKDMALFSAAYAALASFGAKNEAYFQTRWSKYCTGERKRGHINSHCTAWGGAYRTSSIYDLSPEDILLLDAK